MTVWGSENSTPEAWRFGMQRGLRGTALRSRLVLGILYLLSWGEVLWCPFMCIRATERSPDASHTHPEISAYNKRLNTGHNSTGTYSQPWEGRSIA